MIELLGIISNLVRIDSLSLGNRTTVTNVGNLNIIVMQTGKEQEQSSDVLNSGCQDVVPAPPAKKSDVVTCAGSSPQSPYDKSKHHASLLPKDLEVRETVLPMSIGLYFDFTAYTLFKDNWWEKCPPFFDIAANAKLVPMCGSCANFKSVESESRSIEVKFTSCCCEVTLSHDSMETRKLCFSIDSKSPSRPVSCQSDDQSWSLRYVTPRGMARIELNGNAFVTRYSSRSFSALWWLINHHEVRGDEGYLLLQKAQ